MQGMESDCFLGGRKRSKIQVVCLLKAGSG